MSYSVIDNILRTELISIDLKSINSIEVKPRIIAHIFEFISGVFFLISFYLLIKKVFDVGSLTVCMALFFLYSSKEFYIAILKGVNLKHNIKGNCKELAAMRFEIEKTLK
jgi:hypothetical protein